VLITTPPPLVFHDAFDGIAGTLLSDHTPNVAPPTFVWGDDGSTPVPVLNGLGSIVPEDSDLFDENISIGAPIELYASGYTATVVTTCTLLEEIAGGAANFIVANGDFSVFVGFSILSQTFSDPAFVAAGGVDGTLAPFSTGAIPVADIVVGEPHELKIVVTATQFEFYYDTVLMATVVVPGLNVITGQIMIVISASTGAGTNDDFSMQDVRVSSTS
jgi:hypothetical protein